MMDEFGEVAEAPRKSGYWRRVWARLVTVGLIAASLGLPATSASAQTIPPHVIAAAIQGSATIGGGLCAPLLCTVPGDAGVTWTVTIVGGTGGHYAPPTSRTSSQTTVTVRASAPLTGVATGGGITTGPGGITGGAVISGHAGYGPYCGYSEGTGGAGVIDFVQGAGAGGIPGGPFPGGAAPPISIGVAEVGWEQSAATIIVYHGRVTSHDPDTTDVTAAVATVGTIDGVVSAIPTTGSCAAGTATGFTVVGTAIAAWQ